MPVVGGLGGDNSSAAAVVAVGVVSTTVHATVPAPTATSPTVLTTIFTPPAFCLSDIWDYSNRLEIALPTFTQCYPTGFSPSVTFSPGVCPEGYNFGTITVYGNNESVATCCPRNFSITGNDTICSSEFNAPVTSVSAVFFNTPSTFTITASEFVTSNSADNPVTGEVVTVTVTTITETTTGWIYGTGFEVRWKPTDSEIISLIQLNSTSSSSSTNAPTPAMISTTTTSKGAHISGLDGGQIAGIVIGVLAFCIVLISAVFFLGRAHKHYVSGKGNVYWQKQELDGKNLAPKELSAEHGTVELPQPPAELPADAVVRREVAQ